MNGIHPYRELKMTVTCKACEHQYGAWRERCPACGTLTPPPPKAERERTARERNAETRAVKQRVRSLTECIFCQLRGAKETCPHCDEKIHRTCLRLHVGDCERFQETLRAAAEPNPQEATAEQG